MVVHLPRTLWCSAKHYALLQRDQPVGPVDERRFESILDDYDEDVVFVHVGLSDVTDAFGDDSYEFLLERLHEAFDSVLTPGFTQSFRYTGYFHETESEPELGAFADLFFEDADYRTDDPLHSILVSGDYRFDDCDHHDTFAPEGCYGKLDADNVRILDIGTPWIVTTQLHYVERALDVPYAETVPVEGTIHRADGEHEPVTQYNYEKNKYVYYWNRLKIGRDLMTDGILDHYRLNGLNVISVGAHDMLESLRPRIVDDPYYLVK